MSACHSITLRPLGKPYHKEGNALVRWRLARGLTQAAAGEQLGVGRQQIGHLEGREWLPDWVLAAIEGRP